MSAERENNELYQPSNGTEGMYFMDEFCDKCFYDRNNDCEIIVRAMCFNIEDPEYPTQWVYLNNQPTCTKFFLWRGNGDDPDGEDPPREIPPDDPNQLCFPFVFNEIMEGEVQEIKVQKMQTPGRDLVGDPGAMNRPG